MNNSIYNFPMPENEKIYDYFPGSHERNLLDREIAKQSADVVEVPLIIGGKEVRTGNFGEVRLPHNHNKVVARYHKAGRKEIEMAIKASMEAHKSWSNLSWTIRASIMLKAAKLLSTAYRPVRLSLPVYALNPKHISVHRSSPVLQISTTQQLNNSTTKLLNL